MQNNYLQILELQPGATEAAIKSAYRRLSKKYHPDINKDEEAHEKFLKVHEAYKFLMEVGPTPHQEQTAYNYDPYADEYARWRERARDYARKKAAEAQKQQNELIQKLLNRFKYVAGVILLFNALLGIDYLLPEKKYEDRVKNTAKLFSLKNQYTYDELYFEDFTMRFAPGEIIFPPIGEPVIIVATPMFQKPLSVQIASGEAVNTFYQVYNIYRVFGIIIPIIFLLFMLYLFVMHTPDQQLTLAIFMIFLFLTQVFLFFRF